MRENLGMWEEVEEDCLSTSSTMLLWKKEGWEKGVFWTVENIKLGFETVD